MSNRLINITITCLAMVVFIIFFAAGVLAGGTIYREGERRAICVASGYDGYQHIDDVNYCYSGTGDNIKLVELKVCSEQGVGSSPGGLRAGSQAGVRPDGELQGSRRERNETTTNKD